MKSIVITTKVVGGSTDGVLGTQGGATHNDIHNICEDTFYLCWSDHLDVDDDDLSISL